MWACLLDVFSVRRGADENVAVSVDVTTVAEEGTSVTVVVDGGSVVVGSTVVVVVGIVVVVQLPCATHMGTQPCHRSEAFAHV